MARVRFVQDPAFESRVLADPALRRVVDDVAGQVRDVAEELSPFRTGHLESGIEKAVTFDGSRGTWVGKVTSTDFKSIWNEFGTKHSRAQPFLRPALERVLPGASTVER